MSSMNAGRGRAIVRRRNSSVAKGTIDMVAIASVEVTSEQSLFPIDNVFDGQAGVGGSCWVAESPGEQLVALVLEPAQDVATILVESEEHGDTRTQRIAIALYVDGGETCVDLPARTFRFTPYGPSFHRETWEVAARAVTRVELRVTPEPPERRASLTSVVVR